MAKSKTQIIAEIAPEKMSDEQLAIFVSTKAANITIYCETLKPYYFNLRDRFSKKPKTAKIYGCSTWNEYCEKVLDRTKRAVNYFLAGGNPVSKRSKLGSTLTPERETVSQLPNIKFKVKTETYKYAVVSYAKLPEPEPAPLQIIPTVPPPQETCTQVDAAVGDVMDAIRSKIAESAAKLDPSEREAFYDLLCDRLDALLLTGLSRWPARTN